MPKVSVSGVSFSGHEGVVQDGTGKLHDVNPVKAEHPDNLVPNDGPVLKEDKEDAPSAGINSETSSTKPGKSAPQSTKANR